MHRGYPEIVDYTGWGKTCGWITVDNPVEERGKTVDEVGTDGGRGGDGFSSSPGIHWIHRGDAHPQWIRKRGLTCGY
jgi:hypothetical protein